MPVRKKSSSKASSKSKKRQEPEFGWQNVSLWEADRGNAAFTGKVQFTPEFLEDLLDRVDAGDLELSESGHLTINVSIRDNDSANRNAPVLLGNIYVPEVQEEEDEEPVRRRKTSRR